MPNKKEPYSEEDIKNMMGESFKTASQIPTDTASRVRSELLPMFAHLWEMASGNRPEGMGLTIKLKLEEYEVEVTYTAPPTTQRSGWTPRGQQQQTVFDQGKADALVAEYPDKLKLINEGGKVQIISDKYPGDEVVAKLKATGLRWNGSSKRWEQP